MTVSNYSDTDLEYIRSSILKGVSYAEMAQTLNRSVGAIKMTIGRYHMRPRYWNKERDDILKKSYKYMHIKYIAEKLNCTCGMVYARARRLGLCKPQKFPNNANKKSN